MDADSGPEIFSEISSRTGAFKAERGRVSEADTRVKVVDRILTDVLQWPEDCLIREDHVESGFIDYTLRVQGTSLLTLSKTTRVTNLRTPPLTVERMLRACGIYVWSCAS